MADSTAVTVRGLRKTYGSRVVVDGLDLDVRPGEIVGLAGANGAGKTTTVECIQGLRRPDSGSLRVLGHDPVTEAAQLRSLIGSQLQDSALPDRLRVAEAIELFATPRAQDRGELLGRFGLAQRRRSAFSSLSGGERQRLFLVLALLNRPRLVILDELTQGLDPAARRGVWDAVRQLHEGGTTVLLVTHEMTEARALAKAERLGRESLDEVRLAVGMLRAEGDGGRTTPLPGADQLPALVQRFRSAGTDVTLTVEGDASRLPATTGLAVYRIAQEALTNAVKHEAGAPTSVLLTVDAGTARLAVDTAAPPGAGSGLGLVSMRERAESLGGSCQAGPGGRGWLVAATLPLTPGRRREGVT